MNRALIHIDYTNDFVADNGKLTCGKPAQVIEQRIVTITNKFLESKDFVVFGIDGHKKDDPFHPETTLFPTHNVFGTDGRNLFGETAALFEKVKANPNVYWMDKTRYSAFVGTDLDLQLRMRKITELHLVGVCTDICVLHTAIDAYNKGYTIVVHEDAVASFNESGHHWAINHFKHTLGATVITDW